MASARGMMQGAERRGWAGGSLPALLSPLSWGVNPHSVPPLTSLESISHL